MMDYTCTQAVCLDEQIAVDADMLRIWTRHAPAVWAARDCMVTYYHQGPFTVCLLRHAVERLVETYVGVTKQCRYADRADAWDEDRSRQIALSRALQNARNGRHVLSMLQWFTRDTSPLERAA